MSQFRYYACLRRAIRLHYDTLGWLGELYRMTGWKAVAIGRISTLISNITVVPTNGEKCMSRRRDVDCIDRTMGDKLRSKLLVLLIPMDGGVSHG